MSSSPDMAPAPAPPTTRPGSARPYVWPMVAFLVLTALEGYLPQVKGEPHPTWYPVAYTVKVAIVAALAWGGRSAWRDFLPWPGPKVMALAVALGIAIAIQWVALDGHYPTFKFLGSRSSFDPTKLPLPREVAFLAVRFLGLVLVVPLMEELFWRSLLMRWVIDPDFTRVPVGKVTWPAAAFTTGLFAVAHPEWLPALLTGAAWAWLLWSTGSLAACLISHVAANLALGVYVFWARAWEFW